MGCTTSKTAVKNEPETESSVESPRSHKEADKSQEQSVKNVHGQSVFKTSTPDFSILLIFPKADKQSKWLIDAAEKLNCHCSLMLVNYPGLAITDKSGQKTNQWMEHLPLDRVFDFVIIDRRHGLSSVSTQPRPLSNSVLPSDLICQTLSNNLQFRHSVIAALIPKRSFDQQTNLINGAFNAGFNKCIFEFTNLEDVERELKSFSHNELLLIQKFRNFKSNLDSPHKNKRVTAKVAECPIGTTQSVERTSPNLPVANLPNMRLMQEHASCHLAQKLSKHMVKNSSKVTIDSSSSFEEQEARKMKSYVSVRHERGPSHSIPCSASEAFDQQIIQDLLNSRNKDTFLRFQNLNASSPLCKVISILSSSKSRSSTVVAKDLQKAIDIICKSDVFINQLFKPANQHQDPLTADLIEGLMVNTDQESKRLKVPRSSSTGSTVKSPVPHAMPTLGLTQEIEPYLENDDNWDYDILALENVTQKQPLRFLAMKVFNRFNVFGVLRIEEPVMMAWLSVIEENYHKGNPYHNATHAADVMQSTAYLMRRDLLTSVFDSMDEVAMLLAAVVHDLNHPGRTNPFLVNSNNPLAILYNDLAVLESHHVALAFELTRKDAQINIFQNLTRDEYRTIRGYMIDMVLATEMARHFDHVSKFINNLSKPILQKSRLQDQSSVGSMSSMESGSVGTTHNSSTGQLTTPGSMDTVQTIECLSSTENRAILKRMIIKCSDVNNPTRPLSLCKEWATRIAEEYFCQTEEEKQLGLPIVMPNFDRQTCNIPKSQISFIDFFLKDMFTAFDSVCPIPELIKNLEANYEYWEGLSKPETVTLESDKKS